ncbi:MAG: BadF/BadG/BcrA/BcrD ATPase family protein [Trueperaceae bacterium]|nr:BadF/BadG/BcrA/BcrD ATPase family protein [Trueperaceae bacterium]
MRVLGIDGGGTRTRAAVLDETGRLRAFAEGASVNLDDHPPEEATRRLQDLLAELRRADPSAEAPFDAAFLGLGGVLSGRDRREARRVAHAAGLAAEDALQVHHDAYVALEGGLAGAAGILVVAGTGSNCFGRDAAGAEARCGNWGPILGDEGSGHWLGLQAIRATARAHDGRGRPGPLSEAVLAWLDLHDPEELLRRMHVNGPRRADIAAFAPTLLRLAAEGEPVARDILARGCDELARSLQVVAETLFTPTEPVPVLITGGLGADPTWREAFTAAAQDRVPMVAWRTARLPPVLGAGRLALTQAGVRVDAAVDRALRAAAEEVSG